MKFVSNDYFETPRLTEGELERQAARCDALESIVGQLIGALAANGVLRAEQIAAVLNHDVVAVED